jgi:response regulator RpfG family c-di-GMP phosphodiesterase
MNCWFNIPIEGRILVMKVAFDAMTADRPNHISMTEEDVLVGATQMRLVWVNPELAK